jgi:hypothetical protein
MNMFRTPAQRPFSQISNSSDAHDTATDEAIEHYFATHTLAVYPLNHL